MVCQKCTARIGVRRYEIMRAAVVCTVNTLRHPVTSLFSV